jgi:hypothetical protein
MTNAFRPTAKELALQQIVALEHLITALNESSVVLDEHFNDALMQMLSNLKGTIGQIPEGQS